MKLFGKDLFSYKKEPEFLWNFNQWGVLGRNNLEMMAIENIMAAANTGAEKSRKKKLKKEAEKMLTPKQIYDLKSLNDNKFVINIDKDYLNDQIADLKYKLAALGGPNKRNKKTNTIENYPVLIDNHSGASAIGRDEIESMIERLQNRFKIDQVKNTLEEFPHTTNLLIDKLLKDHKNLRFNIASDFVPDFPKAALDAMRKYDKMCLDLCNKKAVYYVIAQSKDFEQVSRRRDPILLAQSPFGFFWQILGAWDEEMIYLGDL